ncbi:hypothetical protein ACFLQ6_09890 [Thermoproteota archaeon]
MDNEAFYRISSYEKNNILYSVKDHIKLGITMKAKRTQALTLKSGPSPCGIEAPTPVSGELIPVDKLSIFLSSSWILILLILVIPVAFILYRKRDVALKILNPLVSRTFELRQRI